MIELIYGCESLCVYITVVHRPPTLWFILSKSSYLTAASLKVTQPVSFIDWSTLYWPNQPQLLNKPQISCNSMKCASNIYITITFTLVKAVKRKCNIQIKKLIYILNVEFSKCKWESNVSKVYTHLVIYIFITFLRRFFKEINLFICKFYKVLKSWWM